MVTHRSLNKLERKAHMSIHNTEEVREDDRLAGASGFTRDRFGRKQKVAKNEQDA